jgi:hypothetical protein
MPTSRDNGHKRWGESQPERASSRDTAYGTSALHTATACARTLRFDLRELTPRGFVRLLAQLPVLLSYLHQLPRARIRLSDRPTGRMLGEHLALRRLGVPRFRLAQGVLFLPSDFSTYLRGRKRQAVRTNIRHASEAGVRCERALIPHWMPPWADRKLTEPAPTEYWRALDRDGNLVGEAWLTVDIECALLHALGASEWSARWLLHTAIVERLCESSSCRLLVSNSYDAPLMSRGQQYFQHLLGYSVARLCPEVARSHDSQERLERGAREAQRSRGRAFA